MTLPFFRTSTVVALIVLSALTGFSQTGSPGISRDHRERLAILPFTLHGLSSEEGLQLRQRFTDALGEGDRFQVILADSLKGTDGPSDPQFLAKAGKLIGVQKVVHVDAVRREKHYVLRVRLVNVNDAALLYAERIDYMGEYASLLSDIIPEQARKLSEAHLDAKTPWAKAAFLFGASLGAILWIFWHFRRKEHSTQIHPLTQERSNLKKL
jgi:TolB-like protein